MPEPTDETPTLTSCLGRATELARACAAFSVIAHTLMADIRDLMHNDQFPEDFNKDTHPVPEKPTTQP